MVGNVNKSGLVHFSQACYPLEQRGNLSGLLYTIVWFGGQFVGLSNVDHRLIAMGVVVAAFITFTCTMVGLNALEKSYGRTRRP